ncbi:MAG: lipoyl(octanoyl) transferase LipB [Desulfobacterales bacterium]
MQTTTPEKTKSTSIDSAADEGKIITTDHGQLTTDSKACFTLDLGLIDYREAWRLQEKLVAARVAKRLNRDIFLFLEHPAVFTLGRRGGLDNLLVSEAFLKNAGIPVVQVERGGFITYHGPGQIVVYPIINLHTKRIGVKDFVAAMEEAMLRTAAVWNIPAKRNPVNSGIWVGENKMGSIGIALRKGVSFHGLALNVNLDLTPFSWIQPCGLQGVGMTSMANELEREISLDEVRNVLRDQLAVVLGMSFETRNLDQISFDKLTC